MYDLEMYVGERRNTTATTTSPLNHDPTVTVDANSSSQKELNLAPLIAGLTALVVLHLALVFAITVVLYR